ncbi:uncharacterized protein LOC128249258 [Octopus bimaculoides]|uniref:uncharacterized protein LOC128249258 n=1 Tax=Octopus bimaculoides TaxID=37653 RepID=UPI0022E36A92|nr:uncharacterized protein LOC128249258 [Octopus bimaculoides]
MDEIDCNEEESALFLQLFLKKEEAELCFHMRRKLPPRQHQRPLNDQPEMIFKMRISEINSTALTNENTKNEPDRSQKLNFKKIQNLCPVPDRSQIPISSCQSRGQTSLKLSFESIQQFWRYLVHRQTNKQPNTTENNTSVFAKTEVINILVLPYIFYLNLLHLLFYTIIALDLESLMSTIHTFYGKFYS